MAKAMTKRSKAETPAAVKAKGAPAPEPSAGALVPVLKATALSLDVGPRVIKTLAAAAMHDREIKELAKSAERKRYDALASLTGAIVKARKADDSIRLEHSFSGSKVEQARLNNQIGLALGFRFVYNTGRDAKRPRVDWHPDVIELVKGADADAPDIKSQKNTVRTNFLSLLKRCMQTATKVVDDKLKMDLDKESGTLRLSGPSIQKHFGEASVLLNEKQTVQTRDRKGNVTGQKELKARPSYTEIARMAAVDHGKALKVRVDSRAVAQSNDPQKHIAFLCGALVKTLETVKPNDDARKALESARSAIEKVLD